MSLELSIKQLTLSIDILISILEKYNQDSNADLNSATPLPKKEKEKAVEVITEVKEKLTPTPINKAVELIETSTNIAELRDSIRIMCSELVRGGDKNKEPINTIFNKYNKATHLRMVVDKDVSSLYADLTKFKGSLK